MIQLRIAEADDAEVITEIKKSAYNDETRRFGPGRDGGPPGYDNVDETRHLINTYPFYKIMYAGNNIGCFWLHSHGEGHFELEDFCIHPDYQNKGFGAETMILMENLYPDNKKWTLGTPFYSIRNQHLYEKMGYMKIGQTEDGFLFLYEKLSKVVMKKVIE